MHAVGLTFPAGLQVITQISTPLIVAKSSVGALLTDGAGERGRGNDEVAVPSGCGGGPCPECIRRLTMYLGAQPEAARSHGGQ